MGSVYYCTINVLSFYTLISISQSLATNYAVNNMRTELVMTFMIHRHGNRAPIANTLNFATDVKTVSRLTQRIGFGQLTDSGKRTSYKLGLFIRQRYNSLLSAQYNKSEIYIRSTDSTRAKMTILTAMSAVYPAERSWCEGVEWCRDNNWTPVPYTTENPIYDFNLAAVNCPVYISEITKDMMDPAPEMSHYFKFLDQWSSIIGYNITQYPRMSQSIYDVYNSQLSLGVPLDPRIEQILPIIEGAADVAFHSLFGNDKNINLGSGVLLNEFFKAANKVISNENVPKVYVYSAHDVNVYAFMAVTRARPLIGPPKYGSLFALELLRNVKTGQYFVEPVYLKSPEDNDVLYLEVEGCEGWCELSKFHQLVSKYEVNVREWRKQCEWSEDYNFNFDIIN